MANQQIVELNVSPSWWTLVHRRGNGPVPYALQIVCSEFRRRDIVALLATKQTLLVHLLDDGSTNHAELADKLVKLIEAGIEIEPSDLVDPTASVPEQKRISRAELEATLREYEFTEAVASAPGELLTIWSLSGGSIYVGLTGSGADDNCATWGSAAKAEPGKPLSYAGVAAELQRIADRGEVDGTDVTGSVFDRPEVG
jgi:hypothetical protein